MSPLQPGGPGDGHGADGDDGDDEPAGFRPPLPPEDRIWRHPSEVAAMRATALTATTDGRGPGNGRLVAVGLLAAGIGATLSIGVVALAGGFERETRLVERQVAVQPVSDLGSDADNVAAVTTRTAPAIVALTVTRDGGQSAGTAVAYRSDGHLVTSAQLIADADRIDARLHDGTVTEATVVGVDDVTDVAVLRVDGVEVEPAVLGTAEALQVGDRTIAVATDEGGTWAPVVATGVVSAIDRRLQTEDGRILHGMIVVDVPLAGAGGGALVDAHGAVVGLASGVRSGTDLGMATPIDLVQRVADDLIEHGRARHVWLGVEGVDVDLATAKDLDIRGGAVVRRVVDAGPAAAAGLLAGDVVLSVDDEAIGSMSDLIATMRMHRPGDVVVLTVRRGEDQVVLQLTLAERA